MSNDRDSLKSAYELACARLAKQSGQSRPLTEEQKRAIAEVERKAKAKTAELEIMLKSRLMQAGDDGEKIDKIKSEYQAEIAKIRGKAEEEKERVREER